MLKYKKFQVSISKRDVLSKNDQKLWLMQKPSEKLLSFVIILLWDVIYAHFYNWDCPLDLELVVYDLIELIIEASLWSKDYSTFDTHTQHTSLMFNEYLFCFWKWFVSLMFFKVFQIVFVWKTCFLGVFVTYFMCKFNWELNGPIPKFFSFGQKISWLFHSCFTSKAYQRNISKIPTKFSQEAN